MATDTITLMRSNLDWLRQNREEWKVAYQDAVRQKSETLPDICVEQISTFDYLVQRAEDFLNRHK